MTNANNEELLETDFNNQMFRQVLAAKMGVPVNALIDTVMPQVGEKFMAFSIQWVITYRRERPFRISAEPCAVVKQVDPEQAMDMRGGVKNAT